MEEACYDQNPSTQDSYHEDEVLDTLSLSDLLIYANNDDPQDLYGVDDGNPNLDHDDDQFEFSSELLSASVNNSVVFCGKIIPYKEHGVSQNTHKLESKKQQKRHKRRWRFLRFFKKSSTDLDSEKLDLKYEVPIRRVSILASATKPIWYLLMFGFGSSRFSTEMHIRDLKKRQTSMGTRNGGDDKISDGNGGGGGIGSWRMVRFLGCGGGGGGGGGGDGDGDKYHPSSIVKIE